MSTEEEEAPDYLKDFVRYHRARLIEYAMIRRLQYDFDDDHTAEDIIRIIKGALWERSCPYEHE